jgi:hypothetical protein
VYKYGNAEQTVIISADGMSIPAVGGNRHYREVLDWVEAGGVIEPYEAPPPPPVTTVTPRQARLALSAAGLLPTVEAMIAAADPATKITWEYATEFDRNNPLIIALGAQLNLTEEQIDNLFVTASTL